jgi:hypothetical protein
MTKIAGSGFESGSISQRHGSAYPDPDPDKHHGYATLLSWAANEKSALENIDQSQRREF